MEANVAGNTYDKYATTNPIERRIMDGFFASLDHCLDDVAEEVAPRRIVEVGAGEGRITERLVARFPTAEVVGLDLPDAALADEWAAATAPMLFGDATRLPFADRSLDVVVGLEVLEHVAVPERALAEMARVARRAMVLSVPREPIWRVGNVARGRYVRALGNTPGHVNHWSSRAFERLVARHLDVVRVERPLPWTMLVARPPDP